VHAVNSRYRRCFSLVLVPSFVVLRFADRFWLPWFDNRNALGVGLVLFLMSPLSLRLFFFWLRAVGVTLAAFPTALAGYPFIPSAGFSCYFCPRTAGLACRWLTFWTLVDRGDYTFCGCHEPSCAQNMLYAFVPSRWTTFTFLFAPQYRTDCLLPARHFGCLLTGLHCCLRPAFHSAVLRGHRTNHPRVWGPGRTQNTLRCRRSLVPPDSISLSPVGLWRVLIYSCVLVPLFTGDVQRWRYAAVRYVY